MGDYGLLGAGPDRSLSTYTAGASVTIPLFTGGRLKAQIAAAEVKVRQAETELRQQRLAVAQQVERAAIESDGAREALESYTQAAAEARLALELARMRFAAGLTFSVDVATAEGARAGAEDAEDPARVLSGTPPKRGWGARRAMSTGSSSGGGRRTTEILSASPLLW